MISLSKTKNKSTDQEKLADLFNSHCINIVKISSSIKTETTSSKSNINGTDEIQHIVNLYKDHPSIKQIKKKIIPDSNKKQVIFSFKPTTVDNVKKLIETDTKKAVGIDTIPPKLIKLASNILAPILTTAINSSIENSVFSENAKVATVVPFDNGKPDKPMHLLHPMSCFTALPMIINYLLFQKQF